MNQYKSIFQGTVDPNSEFAQLKRAHNSQKVLGICPKLLERMLIDFSVYARVASIMISTMLEKTVTTM